MVDAGLDPGHDGNTFSSAECHHWGSLIAQLDDLCIVIGVQQCITTEVAANIHKNLHQFFFNSFQQNVQGVRCVRNLDGWSRDRGASPAWGQDWPTGETKFHDCPLTCFFLSIMVVVLKSLLGVFHPTTERQMGSIGCT